MRIEFMAPDQHQRRNDVRVDIQDGIHARACTGGNIALVESDPYQFSGKLPDGTAASIHLRVTRPHALVMLKCLAMDDRYRNLRGPAHAGRDRDDVSVHVADIIAIASAQSNLPRFQSDFDGQFRLEPAVGARVRGIVQEYFGSDIAPGFLLYEEFLTANRPMGGADDRETVASDLRRAHSVAQVLLPLQ